MCAQNEQKCEPGLWHKCGKNEKKNRLEVAT